MNYTAGTLKNVLFHFSQLSAVHLKWTVLFVFEELTNGKIEFLMEYENIGLYAHFALFSRFLAILFSKILSKMCSKSATYDPIALKCHFLHQLSANVCNAVL